MNKRETIWAFAVVVLVLIGGYLIVDNKEKLPDELSVVEEHNEAVENTIDFVIKLDGIPREKISLVSIEEVEWPNGCLGLPMFDEICTQALMPGYRITLDADGAILIFRTNKTGTSIRRDLAAESK